MTTKSRVIAPSEIVIPVQSSDATEQRGEQQSDSDLDILVAFDNPVTLFDLIRLENELTEELGIEVDLVTKDSLKPQMKARVHDDLVRV
ncbi:nucleotidyltransferase domain-containing protein [Halorubrum ezzemoulense]|uniref:nucleotidyltransferase family protein n=1 Tax=Halorubrum ezzemoulense TaxID=337243 RepID=UPI00232CC512|nr:nucleotidyltransferase domain-containing protein [Halorubrum ezzemoulense]MDB2260610.1 nucleotidyltransferase domain-containing protein [Halorubrum ezzemoulense]MDB2268118.1 nucleotidyltransferase domain-containing protein [Halorubrum ezzemoulense]MDB2276802.1 nucleotidyltransferase domain-containing protein [Halorubrum ezzemoulense]